MALFAMNRTIRKIHSSAAIALAIVFVGPLLARAEVVNGLTQITFNDNGAWSWFEDERAIITGGKLIVGSVADGSGSGGSARSGDIEVATYDFGTGVITQFLLHNNLEDDDHNSPALHVRPDGRILASYGTHGLDSITRTRVTVNPGDTTRWQAEVQFDNISKDTYSNLFRLSAENGGAGQTYNFVRTIGRDPNFLLSNDDGDSWTYGGRLLDSQDDINKRPYLKYASNDVDEIHFINTEEHPRNFDNSIYHGYIKGGQVFKSDGTLVGALDAVGESSTDFTKVFAGDVNNVAWMSDIHLDENDRPYIAFSVQKNQNDQDHRYYYGRWDGTQWNVNEMAFAGSRLYNPENDYTGLVALDPSDPDTVYISVDVDPISNVPLISSADGQRHYEIFKGVTTDGGASWNWSPITVNSTLDNIRPIMPKPDGEDTALLWLAGSYTHYTNYDLDVVGIIGSQAIFGDLNNDNAVDILDYALYLAGLQADLSGLTASEAYEMGDLNGDFVNNYEDFLLFQQAYDFDNGSGAFAAMVASVPEPSALALMVLGSVFLLVRYNGCKSQLKTELPV